MQRLNVDTGKVINHYFFGTTRNILLGLSLGYAVQNEKYYHIPIIFFVPSIYTGYQVFQKKDNLISYIKKQLN
jgi:hypothetical protein